MTAARDFPWRWVIAGLAIAVIIVTVLVPPPGEGSDEESTGSTTETDSAEVTERIEEINKPDTISVLVLNGTEIEGLAGRTQRVLLQSSSDSTVILAPFDPTDTRVKPFEETILISHLDDISAARVICSILDRPEDCIVWEVPAGGVPPKVDVTVCLGRDMGEVNLSSE